MDNIEVDINTNLHDMRVWGLWRLFHSKLYYFYVFMILFVSIIIMLTDFGENDYIGVIFVATVIVILPVVGCMGIVKHTWKQIKDRKKHIIRFEKEGIRLINDRVEILYKWTECAKVTETRKYLFAETNDGDPLFALCKYRHDENILDEINQYLTHKGVKFSKSSQLKSTNK